MKEINMMENIQFIPAQKTQKIGQAKVDLTYQTIDYHHPFTAA